METHKSLRSERSSQARDEDPGTLYRRLARFFSAAIDVRNGIELNRQDKYFTEVDHGIVRYVLDSNVVLFFLNPVREKDAVDPFMSLDERLYSALALVTAEYIFSRDLVGQWGAPPLISHGHWREVDSAIKTRLGAPAAMEHRAPDACEDQRKLGDDVAEIVRNAQAERSLEFSVANLAAMEPHIRKLVDDDTYVRTMFERLRKNCPIDSLTFDENAFGAVLNPDEDRVKAWEDRISEFRENSDVGHEPHSKNNRRDAETVEQLVQLNLNARTNSTQMTRYVLVTHDRALFNAGVKWWYSKPELDFFPFRRLSQYIPVLNTGAMPNSTEDSGVARELAGVLDGLLDSGRRGDRRFPLFVPVPTVASPKESVASYISSAVKWIVENTLYLESHHASRSLWEDLSASSILLNSELLRRRVRAFAPLAEFIESSSDVRQGVVAFMHDRVQEFEAAHLELNLVHQLANEVLKAQTQAQNSRALRGMLVLREDLARVFGGSGQLYGFLEEIVRNSKSQQIRDFADRLSGMQRHECHFVAGCVAFWSGCWNLAEHHASRALATYAAAQHERDPRMASELAYFAAVAKRYSALDIENDLGRTERQLRSLASDVKVMRATAVAAEDGLAGVRAEVEHALHLISLAYVIALGDPTRGREAEDLSYAAYAVLEAIEGEAKIVSAQLGTETATLMRVDLLTGVVGCLLLQAMNGTASAARLAPRWSHARMELKRALREAPNLIPAFYEISLQCYDLILCEDPGAWSPIRKQLVVSINHALGDAQHMTWFDRYALDGLRMRIENLSPPIRIAG